MPKYFQTIIRLARLLTKAFFRDKIALFFTFVFPLIFLFVFGSLNRNDQGISFNLAIINESTTDFSKSFVDQLKQDESVEVKEGIIDLDGAKQRMSRGELDTILRLPIDFGQPNDQNQPRGQAEVYFDPSNAQTGKTFASIVEGIFGKINRDITAQEPLFQ